MQIDLPSDAELAELVQAHRHRYPEKLRLVVSDGGEEVALPILLGNPSSTSSGAESGRPSRAWDSAVSAAFQMGPEAEQLGDQLVFDCLLWPNAAIWAGWTRRWAALSEIAQAAIRRKIGASLTAIEEPSGEPPAAIAAALARRPGSVARRLRPSGAELLAVISPPELAEWRSFCDEMKRPMARAGLLARKLSDGCLEHVARSDETEVSSAELLDRWPGLALPIGAEIAHLAGLTARIELGGW